MENNIIVTTTQELTALVESAVERAITKVTSTIETPTPDKPEQFIRGIKGLAAFLKVSIPTAQKMKNNGVFPCYQDGRVCVFKPNEVLKGMSNRNV